MGGAAVPVAREGVVTVRSLPPFPQGWFAVGFADELQPGEVLTRAFMGGELVLFRTEAGVAAASNPWCPHLGTHLGQGRVEDGTLRCPLHGFRFGTDGACVATGQGTRPPPRARLAMRPLREVNGLLLVWHDPLGVAPVWEPPAVPAENFTPLATAIFYLPAHPQDTTESGVDFHRLTTLHGHQNVSSTAPVEFDGPHFRARYALRRDTGLFGRGSRAVRMEFAVEAWGLGYSRVDVSAAGPGLFLRHFVLATPTSEGQMDLRIGVSLRRDFAPGRVHPMLGLMPRGRAERVVLRRALQSFVQDLQRDFAIWSRKTHLDRPALADGEAALARFRHWTRQFYPAYGLPTGRHDRIAREKKA